MARSLTVKQRKFIEAYLQCFNATEAARQAGYDAKNGSFRRIGAENLSKLDIKNEISEALNASAMSPDEILMRLSDTARANPADFAGIRTLEDLKGHPNARAVKELRKNKDGSVTLKLHDPGIAQERLAKCHSMFSEKIEIEPSDKFTQLLKDLKNGSDE